MNKKKHAQRIQDILHHLFPDPEIPLQYRDPYTLLIAVVLSAQNTDKKVNQVTPALFAKASTPQQMLNLSIEEIASIIKPCGLSNIKARSIWNLSKILVEQHKGRVPNSLLALEKLPGVGHKTASVVVSQGFGKPAFPVDTHIHRCAKRWLLSRGKTVEETEKDLKHLFPKKSWNKLHLQMIYFAREYCPARGHKKEACPICQWIDEPSDCPMSPRTS
ncbi:Endonuclease III [Candidatus Rhabdochlamydia oedothoracis]|uniref:Endonuclease III n=1 Tax=Candidatus Rhabdochlamydia oedothoracis TaxID=2720720 RepID=A0ABX8UYP1_9BACT|nr:MULTISPECIES: endonuclease III [Rhabdochlamydia]KAG6559591.1 Endonuclease III [Candidatus Rhabdochlamydia sp. W815]QYF47966.1 Endonuclease III [Candidatus Rhabdochlamydia oedothoracis]